ncbi:alpha/beta hydrolase [Bacterioplanes sanyensis]|uniref:Alpha/beta hydrolase n=1 Tax=Bacterioplanes sanyensis TaxID=1249553 RepID=A0A222FJS3_9GAMM|nr:alpha/beta hydrolase [Bacterioplanes sanyensis]ASP38989.1 alpha/beta hydrolase [Bacterioplanes sanyensis]
MTSPSITTLVIKTLLAVSLVLTAGCAPVKEQLFDWGLQAERSLSDLSLHYVEAGPHRWAYLDSGQEGDSRPVLLLLHGFAVDKDNWLRFARHLSDFRIIAPDFPGHGDSSYQAQLTYNFTQQSQWLAAFIDAIGLQRMHVVGNSMGGGIAVLLAHQHPQRVQSLTLMNAAGVFPPKPSEFQRRLEETGDNPLVVQSHEDFLALQAFALEQPPFLPWPATDVLAQRAMARSGMNEKIFVDIMAEAEQNRRSGDNLTRLAELTVPVMIVWGEQDRVLDVSSVAVFRQHIRQQDSYILPGVGHAPMLEVPQTSANLVAEFVTQLD